MLDRPVFVVGGRRSGTTLLRLILDSHPNIAIGEETGFMRAVDTIIEIPNFHAGKEWYERYDFSTPELYERIRQFYAGIFEDHAMRSGKIRWGEKTPFHRLHMETMAEIFPGCQFVASVRHPGAVATSLKRWGYDWEDSVRDWENSYQRILKVGGQLGPARFRILKYEDLLLDPEPVLQGLVNFLGEPWSDNLLRHHEIQARQDAPDVTDGGTKPREPLDPGRIDAWREEVLEQEIEVLESIDASLITRFGYSISTAVSASAHGRDEAPTRTTQVEHVETVSKPVPVEPSESDPAEGQEVQVSGSPESGNRVWEMYEGSFGSEDSYWHERERVHWVCEQVRGERVLEVGCSQGIICVLLGREGFDVTGIDVDGVAIEFAQQRLEDEPFGVRERVEFLETDASLDRFDDEAFDCVVMAEVVEHLTQPWRLVEQARRVLATGGRLVITTTLGLYPDPDHKESLFASDLIDLFAEWFDCVDTGLVSFPRGRFNNVCLTMTKRSSPASDGSNRLEYLEPLLDVTERGLWSVQQGAEEWRLETVELRQRSSRLQKQLDQARSDLEGLKRDLAEVRRSEAVARRERGQAEREREEAVQARREAEGRVRALQGELDGVRARQAELAAKAERAGALEGEVARLREELEQFGGSARVQALASRLVAAQHDAAQVRFALRRLESRRVVRWALFLLEVLRRPWRVFSLRRWAKLFQQVDVGESPEPLSVQQVLAEVGKVQPTSVGGRRVATARVAYPNLRVARLGVTDRFSSVVLSTQMGEGWREELEESGFDLLVVEPSGASQSPLSVEEVVAGFADAEVPVVVLAQTLGDLAILEAVQDGVVVAAEDDEIVEAAIRLAGHDAVLSMAPSVDLTVFNPVGWQREPEGRVLMVLGDGSVSGRADGSGTALLEAAGADLQLVTRGSGGGGIPALVRDRPTTTVGSDQELVDRMRKHRVALVLPEFHDSERTYIRQVLELMAVGTPVVTTGSPALEATIDTSLVMVIDDPADAPTVLAELCNDPHLREKRSVRARRAVLSDHTRRDRFEALLRRFDIPTTPPPMVSVLLSTNRPQFLEHGINSVAEQRWDHKELILILHGDNFDDSNVDKLTADRTFPVNIINAPEHWTLGDCLNAGIDSAAGTYIAKMDDDDFYGPNHLTDLILAMNYTNADIVGKAANFTYLSNLDMTISFNLDRQESVQPHLPGATMMMRRRLAREYRIHRLNTAEDSSILKRVRDAGGILYSTHRFDFVRHRHGVHSFDQPDSFFLERSGGDVWSGLAEEEAFA